MARGSMSQEAFAKAVRISKGSLGFYERNENLPNVDVVIKICSETGVALEWLMTGNGPMRRGQDPLYESGTARVSPETAGMLAGMHGKLALLEQEVARNRTPLNRPDHPDRPDRETARHCGQCLELYAKLDRANERLYEAMKENGELKAETGRLHERLAALKNEPSAARSDD